MATIKWSEREPRDTDRVERLSEQWPSTKTAIANALDEAFYFTSSLVSAGDSLYTTGGRGAASIYSGPRSAVSDPSRDGALMIISDESRMLVFDGSESSEIVGSTTMITHYQDLGGASVDSLLRTIKTDSKRVWAAGSASVSAGANTVSLPVQFSNTAETPPDVFITPGGDADSACSYRMSVTDIDTSSFDVSVAYLGPGVDPDTAVVYFVSIGTLPA